MFARMIARSVRRVALGAAVGSMMTIQQDASMLAAAKGTLVGTGTLGGVGRGEPLKTLYPAIEPYMTGRLEVGSGHSLYYEQCGNANGKPVVFVHGGPGSGCSASNRCFFDPELYRIILIDQRGAGRSTPSASLEDNTTWDLVKDLERLRTTLDIDKWMVFGGSWGSTLLDEGKRVLSTMGPLLRGPTRVLKFGAAPTVHFSSRRTRWRSNGL